MFLKIVMLFIFNFPLKATGINEDVVISTQSKTAIDIYNPKKKRNPMVISNVKESVTLNYDINFSTDVIKLNEFSVKNFSLQGIIRFMGIREALLKNNHTGEVYILRNKKLYDIKKKELTDIYGEIRGKSVYLKNKKNNEEVELFLSEEESL